jgi:hypothetical protein
VLRKKNGDRIYVLLLYVDNILANINKEEAERLRQNLIKQFGTVQLESSGRFSYLGMQIDIMMKRTIINMSFYVK